MALTEISATFEVSGGTTGDYRLDISGLSLDEIAERLQNDAPGISLCHQCARDIVDPESGELTSFYIDDKSYSKQDDGHWGVDR